MATTRSKTDKYVNILDVQVTQGSTNTLTFQEVEVGLNLFDKVGLLIHRWEVYGLGAIRQEMEANADTLQAGLTQSNQISSLVPEERSVIDMVSFLIVEFGTAASGQLLSEPYIKDYSSMPGNGILVAPKPLYLAMDSTGFGNTRSIDARIYFTIVQLKDAEYFELLESRRFYG
jgi:hypothetical protein